MSSNSSSICLELRPSPKDMIMEIETRYIQYTGNFFCFNSKVSNVYNSDVISYKKSWEQFCLWTSLPNLLLHNTGQVLELVSCFTFVLIISGDMHRLLSILLIMRGPDEDYSRNLSCALNFFIMKNRLISINNSSSEIPSDPPHYNSRQMVTVLFGLCF